MEFLPYGHQNIEKEDIEAVIKALNGDLLTTGPIVNLFESKFAQLTGAKYAVAVSNGTAALHLACLACGLGEGDVAIVPAISFLATANAPSFCGSKVIFCDVEADTGIMNVQTFEAAILQAKEKGLNVKVVIPVHLTGRPVDLTAIKKIAAANKIKVIADSCHALGGEIGKVPIGACKYEDFSTFSFHPVKTICTGEGGAITTNNKNLADFMKTMRHHGITKRSRENPWLYKMDKLGFNYRITDFQCALGISQLAKLDKMINIRADLVSIYNKNITKISAHIHPPEGIQITKKIGWHLYSPRIDFASLGIERSVMMQKLKEKGIGTQVHYKPINTQPYYRKFSHNKTLPGAEQYFKRTLSLPLHSKMSECDVERVLEALQSICNGR